MEKEKEKSKDDERSQLEYYIKRAAKVSSNVISPLAVNEVKKDDEIYVCKIFGGINGRGSWRIYHNSLSTFMDVLYTYYGIDSWIIKIENDCLDDVFTAEIGVRYRKEHIGMEDIDDDDIFDIGKLARTLSA